MAVGPDTPITQLAGVGEARAKKLAKLGLAQAADLFPRCAHVESIVSLEHMAQPVSAE